MKFLFTETANAIKIFTADKRIAPVLNDIKSRAPEVYRHSGRVACLAVDIGYENKFRAHEIRLLGYAALLHDAGKIGIDPNILAKNGKLDDDEELKMREHVRLGFSLLNSHGMATVKKIIAPHHEYKPNPYPRNSQQPYKNDRRSYVSMVSKLAEVLAAADVYDSLRSRRAYKQPLPPDVAAVIMAKEFTGDQKYTYQLARRG